MSSERWTADAASSSKRRKVSLDTISDSDAEPYDFTMGARDRAVVTQEPTSKSLSRPITPPPSKRSQSEPIDSLGLQRKQKRPVGDLESASIARKDEELPSPDSTFLPSQFQLTRIKDLSSAQNVDTIGLGDILGDPLIKQCWNFNFLFDLDFVMQHLDQDVRDQVQMKIVHGFWKREDERKLSLEEAASRYPNIKLIGAYMPDPFGTHHSKMLILIRHDDQAQVIIHTANMISRDWGNMTQAIWRSPLLPLRVPTGDRPQQESYPIGSGQRFKVDLLRYVGAYGRRLSELKSQLQNYDFSAIRAAFIGSTPSREKPRQAKPNLQTLWGWPGIQEILSNVPIPSASSGGDGTGTPNIIIQISSIATLGPTTTWLENFQRALSKCKAASSTTNNGAFTNARKPTFNIIFPTATEIRTSLDGYASGASIHTKLQSHTQQKQLDYLRPYLRHWKHLNPANDAPYASTSPSPSPSPSKTSTTTTTRSADRGPAAPHIKTYIRFHDKQQRRIDWAMVTSANLSKQAWGEVENKNGEVWIQSWECGVVVWPALFPSSLEGSSDGKQQGEEEENGNGEEGVEMVPVFGKDTPSGEDIGEACARTPKVLVGLRMPYDLPLEPYGEDDVPWCASMVHEEPDWMGRVWGV